jgi:putative restriction endonuclease
MNGWIANTDLDWYRFLAARPEFDEVNFWQPSGRRSFRAIRAGEPFFFKLKAPHNAIAGFGLFAKHDVLPDWLAWEAFEQKNGAPDYDSFRRGFGRYVQAPTEEHQIGCLMVAEPVFFPETLWIPQPRDWSRHIQQGKRYDLSAGEGLRIWEECLGRARAFKPQFVQEGDAPRFGAPQLVRPRLGQGTFRVCVTEAYDRTCAVTTEHSLPVLEAAHIRPYTKGGAHDVRNGLLLRTDIHRLFDRGFVTVTPEGRFEVSRQLGDRWRNGRIYYELSGREIRLPDDPADRPDPALLSWHGERVFLG